MARLCEIEIMSFLCVHMACVQNIALALHGENQGSRGEACNTWSPPHGDVHVHQPKWDLWIFQGTWEGDDGGEF